MAAKKRTRDSKKVKTLPTKRVSAKQAAGVKGGITFVYGRKK